LLRQILSRRSVVQTVFGAMSPGWATMALLFAADRQDHLEAEILPLMRDGVLIISDRYDLSSLAYQSVTAQNDAPGANQSALEWIHELNRHARRPDLTLVLDVTAEIADQRRRARGGWKELYDDRDVQERLVAAYRRAEDLVAGDRIVHLDATRSPEQVLGEALDTIGKLART
jgi:dTMP kinase